MIYIDAHAHVNFAQFDEDREEVLARSQEAGVAMINVGTDRESSERAVDLAQGRENVWATVGLHPTDFAEGFDYGFYKDLASDKKVVAIGECGLDRGRKTKPEALNPKQREIFKAQIELALELQKPLMIHCRNAYQDLLDALSDFDVGASDLTGNVHFFAGSWEEAKKFLDLGFTLSFTGVITFARNYDVVIKNAPRGSIISETDCPFVAPVPYRGKRNEPAYVTEVVKKMAEIRGEDVEILAATLVANASRLFRLGVA